MEEELEKIITAIVFRYTEFSEQYEHNHSLPRGYCLKHLDRQIFYLCMFLCLPNSVVRGKNIFEIWKQCQWLLEYDSVEEEEDEIKITGYQQPEKGVEVSCFPLLSLIFYSFGFRNQKKTAKEEFRYSMIMCMFYGKAFDCEISGYDIQRLLKLMRVSGGDWDSYVKIYRVFDHWWEELDYADYLETQEGNLARRQVKQGCFYWKHLRKERNNVQNEWLEKGL